MKLDIIFSSSSNSEDLKRKLEQLNTVYSRRQWTLTSFIQFVQEHRFEIASTNDEGHDRSARGSSLFSIVVLLKGLLDP